jgi:PAS domain S-box-containing protein
LASVTVQKDEKGNLLRTEGIIRDVTEKKKAEKALKESEEKYKTLVEQSLQGVLVAQGPVPRIVFANATMSKILGYTPEEMISFSPQQTLELVHPDDRELFFGRFKDRLEGNSPPSNYMIRGVRKDGTIVWLELSSSRIDYDGRPAAQAMFMDITERKKAEECLRQSEEKFRTIVENSQDVIMLTKPDGIISYLSPSCSRVLGYDPEDLVGKQPWIIHPDDLEDVKKVHYQALKGLNGSMEYRILTKAGETRWVHHSWSSLMTNSQLQLIISVVKDISERKKAEEDLRESEGRYKDLFESIQDPVGIFVGREGRLIDYNTAFKRSCGYTDEELKDKAFLDFVHPDDHALVLQKYQTEYSEEELPLVYEIRGTNKKGESLPLELSVSTYKKKGRVVGIEVIHRDMTERKHYERSLSGLNIHSRKLNTAKNMEEIYELTLNAAEKTLGFEFADIFMVKGKMLQLVTHRGKTKISSLTLPMDGDKGITIRAARTGKPVLVPDISKEEAYVEGEEGGRSELAVPIKFGPRVLGVLNVESKELDAFNKKDQELLEILASHAATAISNLDRARELETYSREIQETKHKFEGLFLGNPEATIYLDPDFRILDVNPRFEELFGDSLSEIKGKCIGDVIVPENMIEEAEMLDKKAVEGYVYHNTFRMRKDGSLVPVSISAAPILIQGQLAGYIGVYKDISELKKTERDLAIMNEKLRVVGGLTRHDVRNKLSAITGNSYLLKKQLAGNSEALDKLGDMETAVQQAVRIFEFARTYEMLGAEELAYINVEKSVSEAVSLFSDLKGAKVINDCRGLCVLADSLLRQLFYNLIDNSLKYGQRTTQIRIHYEKTRDDQLKLIYKDDGIGISEDVRPKLFTEGFTTGRGSGYGLYFIKKMVEVYGWIIEETGGPGKGAQFVMTIPRMNPNGKENYKTV